ncbi:MAG: flagellar basal body rod protein FlgC [Alphaproteobacteria bacterium]
MEFDKTMAISASALRAQGQRMRVIAENLANANSVPSSPEQEPYRRKVVSFDNELNRELGVNTVKVNKVSPVAGEFAKRFDPDHPGADDDGYVRVPNVNSLIEVMDMREAQRTYEANLQVIEAAKRMLKRTVDLLK